MLIDPVLFHEEAVTEETVSFTDTVRQIVAAYPKASEMASPQAVRDARRSGEGPFPITFSDWAVNRTIPGPQGDLPIRVFAKDRVRAVYLHIHGGGWVLGAEDLNDPLHEMMVEATDVAVVSVGYRLAPEHKWPAGNEDCEAAAAWLIEHAAAEFGTDAVFIGGESAGAHLSATTMLRMRDRHGYSGWRGANLVYGAYDMRPTHSKETSTRDPILDKDGMDWFADHYLAGTAAEDDLTDPDVSPVMADLADLAPALFTIGTWDPLLDENLTMAVRWLAEGNPTELAVYPGGIHAFNAFPTTLGRQANDRIYSWIRERL